LTEGRPAHLLVSRDQRVLSLKLDAAARSASEAGQGTVQLAVDERASRAARALRKVWLAA
jgi:hypothetical protein